MPFQGTVQELDELLDFVGGFQVKISKAPAEIFSMMGRKKICNNCGTRSEKKLMTCGSCKMARYCNAECAKADWKKHKKCCADMHKTSETQSFDVFARDVQSHIATSAFKKELTVLDAKGRCWAYKSEDDNSYILELWHTPKLLEHLKKIGCTEKAIKWHLKELLAGISFLVFHEGQVACMRNKDDMAASHNP